jgi:hypothetical protein
MTIQNHQVYLAYTRQSYRQPKNLKCLRDVELPMVPLLHVNNHQVKRLAACVTKPPQLRINVNSRTTNQHWSCGLYSCKEFGGGSGEVDNTMQGHEAIVSDWFRFPARETS